MMKRVTIGAAWVLGIAMTATAREAGEEISLRVLTVGNRAPFIQEVRDGVRHEVDPPEGSLPPRKVSVGILSPEEGAEEADGKLLNLRLGEVSAPARLPAPETPAVALRDVDSGRPWLKQGLSGSGATLLVVWRAGKTWEKTRSLALDDSPAAVPAGSCRVVNVAPVEMKLIWGEKRYRLPPGKNVVLRKPAGPVGTPLVILHPDAAGELKPCLSTTVEADERSRRQWIVFRADRADARQPIQVLPLAEAR